ncbi:hypothetical protein [Niallia taxi]
MKSNVMEINMRIERRKKVMERLEDEQEKDYCALDEAMKEEEKELVMI